MLQANCTEPDAATALRLSEADAAGLLPLKPFQCLLLVGHTWLMVNSGTMWLDNLYLRLSRTAVQPRFAFVQAGLPAPRQARELFRDVSIFATNVTFQSERLAGRPARSAFAVATYVRHTAVAIDGVRRFAAACWGECMVCMHAVPCWVPQLLQHSWLVERRAHGTARLDLRFQACLGGHPPACLVLFPPLRSA